MAPVYSEGGSVGRFGRAFFVVCVFAAAVAGPSAHALTAHPADALARLTVGDVGVWEGNSGSVIVDVPVDLSMPSTSTVTVHYALAPGTASAGSDYAAKSGTLTFKAGKTALKVAVKVYGDTVAEGDEYLSVVLAPPVGATIAKGTGTVKIHDDDGAALRMTGEPTVAIGDATVIEADGGVHYVYLPLTLSDPATEVIKIEVSFDCGTALATEEWGPTKSRILTFTARQQSKVLSFKVAPNVTADTIQQFREGMTVIVGSATVSSGEGAVTVLDNDGGPGGVGSIERLSVASDGSEAQYFDGGPCTPAFGAGVTATSADGQYVLFWSDAVNLAPDDTNDSVDLFVRDRTTNTTERVDLANDGSEFSTGSEPSGAISDDGRYVAFTTTPLTAYVRDRVAETTEPVGILPDGSSPAVTIATGISADGRYVAFRAGDGNLYVRDRVNATTQLVASIAPSWNVTPMTADGSEIAFISADSTLVPGDTNNYPDLFVRNLVTGATERVNVTNAGNQESGGSPGNAARPALSRDGRYVAFWSMSPNMVSGGSSAVFLRDRVAHTTEKVSVGVATSQPLCFAQNEGVSNDGRYVSFDYHCEDADEVVKPTDTEGIYLHDRTTNSTVRVDTLADGTPSDADYRYSVHAVMSADGRYMIFDSIATNLVPGDNNDQRDVFAKRVT
jgi:Tol biopolymer transport system component